MKLLQRMAEALTDAWLRAGSIDLTHANAEAYVSEALASVEPCGWLIEFPNGSTFVDSDVIARVNLANGYKVTPCYLGEQL